MPHEHSGAPMTATTLPTSRPVTQDWNQDFQWLNGKFYPNGFYSSLGWKGHNGIDYGCPEGDPVEAVCDGVIEFAGNGNNHPLLTGGGNAILLRNDDIGVRFEYLHLSRFDVTHGQRVSCGQVIARSGNTGISSAPHLHLGAIPVRGVDVNNGYRGRIDPTPYLYGNLNPDYAGTAAIGPQGTITTAEEEDMTAEDTQYLKDKAARAEQLLLSFQAVLTDPVTGVIKQAAEITLKGGVGSRYVRSEVTGEDTVYERTDDGKLRAIGLAEFQLAMKAGETYRLVPKWMIDAHPKEGA